MSLRTHLLVGLCLLILAAHAIAEDTGGLRFKKTRKIANKPLLPKELRLEEIEDVDLKAAWEREANTTWTTPSSSISTPAGYGAGWGVLYGGVSFQSRTILGPTADGVAFFGFGLGDPQKNIGLETNVAITDLDPFGKDFTLGFKAHRLVGANVGVAMGCESCFEFGESSGNGRSFYLVVSKAFLLKPSELEPFSNITLHAGYGTGRFKEQEVGDKRPGTGFFGSLGIRVLAPISIAGSWSGQDLDLGISIAPFRSFRLTLNPSVLNVAGVSQQKPIPALTIVYGDSFFSDTFPFFSARSYR